MNNIDFITQFSILPGKYIVLYNDDDLYINDNNILLNNNLNIIRLLDKYDNKQNLNLNEIYSDEYTEDILISHCLCVIYLSKKKRSNILIDRINLYNKYIFYEQNDILINIQCILNNDIEKIELLKDNNNDFKIFYSSLIENKNITSERNIKLEYNKIHKEYNINTNNKINVITYFKNSDIKILNIIQKKCVIENLRNKSVSKVIVLGNDINNNFQDIINDTTNNLTNLQLIEFNNNITYKDLIDISNKLEKGSITCILRSDIILPNQNELDDLEFDLLSTNNKIYALSRVERLINGNLIRSEKLNKTLSSIEQDAWIFKSPININIDLLDNIFFYNKYSELQFNKILTSNNYKLINNSSKIKIIRILYENNIENRILLNNTNIKNNINDLLLLPDNDLIDKISFDNLLNILNINNNDINEIKCDIFNKYFKNKIINELN
jgi:hypothetical protein